MPAAIDQRVPAGIEGERDLDVVRDEPEPVGDDLRQHGLVALALHGDVGGHRDRAERIDVDGDHGHRAVLGPGALAGIGGEQRREIAHVRHAGLDHGGKADAVEPAGGARGVALAPEIIEPAAADRGRHGAPVVAGIVEGAGRGAEGELGRGNEVAPDHVEMVEPELDGDALHQPLEGEIELWPAEAADQARRHLVGEHDAVGHVHIGNVVGAGDGAMHAVERPRHRRAQEGAVVLALVEPQRQDAALFRHGGLDLGDAVGSRACGDEVLDPVLDPLHRPPGDLRGDRGEHHIGKHRELDAEAAATVGRDAQPHLGAGDAQRFRHHRMGAERPLEVRHHIIALVVRAIFGDHHVAFHRREREPRIVDRERDPGIGRGERGGGVAIANRRTDISLVLHSGCSSGADLSQAAMGSITAASGS